MTSPSLVSIVIPCRDQAHFLGSAIRSALAQTWPAVEVIVVDDGSSDATVEIAERLGVAVLRQPHSGVSVARNRGLAAAQGEFVVLLDADDELEPAAVETGVRMLQARPDADMVARCCVLIDDFGRELETRCEAPAEDDLYSEWLARNLVWTPGAALFRRDALMAMGGFPRDVGPAADYAVYLAFARAERVVFDARPAVRYRQHSTNMSLDPARMLRAVLAVLRRERPRVPERLRARFETGRQAWCTFYGEQIIQHLRADVRAHHVGLAQLSAVWLLCTECWPLVMTHLARKLRRVAAGHRRSEIEPGRFGTPDRIRRHSRVKSAGAPR